MKKIRIGALGLATLGAMGLATVTTGQAQANDNPRASCISASAPAGSMFCYFFNSSYEGAISTIPGSVSNLSGWSFTHVGTSNAGLTQSTKNNAASAYNPTSRCVRSYYNSNYSGPSDYIGAGSGMAQLVNTYNNNASVLSC